MVALTIDLWLPLNAQRIVIKALNRVTIFIFDAYHLCFLALLLVFSSQSSQILDLGDATNFKTLNNIRGQLVHIYMFLVQNLSFWGKSKLYWLILLYVKAQVNLLATMLFHFLCNSCFFQFISFLYFSPLLFSLGNQISQVSKIFFIETVIKSEGCLKLSPIEQKWDVKLSIGGWWLAVETHAWSYFRTAAAPNVLTVSSSALPPAIQLDHIKNRDVSLQPQWKRRCQWLSLKQTNILDQSQKARWEEMRWLLANDLLEKIYVGLCCSYLDCSFPRWCFCLVGLMRRSILQPWVSLQKQLSLTDSVSFSSHLSWKSD